MNGMERRSKLAGIKPGFGAVTGMSMTESREGTNKAPEKASSSEDSKTQNKSPSNVGGSEKITIMVDEGVIGRARAAWLAGVALHPGSFSSWVTGAIEEKTVRTEQELNGGEFFRPIPKGGLPRGPLPVG